MIRFIHYKKKQKLVIFSFALSFEIILYILSFLLKLNRSKSGSCCRQ